MKTTHLLLLFISFFLFSCTESDDTPASVKPENKLYFPPTDGSNWETTTLNSLNWNESELENLYSHLEANSTRGFIVLKLKFRSSKPPINSRNSLFK